MKKLQENLTKLFSQYECAKKAMQFDLILLSIYPIYKILCFCPFEFINSLYKFSTLFLLMFVVGIMFTFVNNKLKELILAVGVLAIVSVVNVFMGNFDGVVYAAIYGFIAYQVYRFMNDMDVKVMGDRKKCPKCGNVIQDGQAFCTSCGEKVE